jgi:hypothetical protein
MHDPNCWLIGLAFVLGLLLTFALMIRRVKREVPVGSSSSSAEAKTPAAEANAADSAEKKGDEDSSG